MKSIKGLTPEFPVEIPVFSTENEGVKVSAGKRQKSEAELLDQGTVNLMRAVKARIIKREGRVNYDKLRKEGYSERFLARFEEA